MLSRSEVQWMQQVVAPHMAAASLTLSVVAAHILAGGASLAAAANE